MVYYVFQVIPVPLNDLGRDGFRSFRGRCEFQEGTNGWDSQKSSQSSSRTGIYHIYIISFIYNICLYIIYVYIYIYIASVINSVHSSFFKGQFVFPFDTCFWKKSG